MTRWLQDPQLRALAAREAAGAGELGPVEVLRGALAATRASGQPDWPTRLAAARALAALRPHELEPEQSGPGLEQPEPSIIVYDLPPGATPVLHRARAGAKAESSPDGAGADGAAPRSRPRPRPASRRPDDARPPLAGPCASASRVPRGVGRSPLDKQGQRVKPLDPLLYLSAKRG